MLVPVAPDRLMLGRARMRLELARHGRVPPDHWAGRDVNEMRHAHAMLLEMIKAEHPEST
jgi:hypothetical protein